MISNPKKILLYFCEKCLVKAIDLLLCWQFSVDTFTAHSHVHTFRVHHTLLTIIKGAVTSQREPYNTSETLPFHCLMYKICINSNSF